MDIDQLLAKHPAPWEYVYAPTTTFSLINGPLVDANGIRIDKDDLPDGWSIESVNAYAALKAENARLRKCVEAADAAMYVATFHGDSYLKKADYDAARKELP